MLNFLFRRWIRFRALNVTCVAKGTVPFALSLERRHFACAAAPFWRMAFD
jgi:hypothetical protein